MTVRGFTELDFPAVCRIYIEAKRDELRFESGEFEITPLDQDDVILAAFKESAVLIFEDKEVLGFAALHDSHLRALFVRRDARGKGVGQALLNAAISANTEGIFLNVAKSNAGARKFYLRNGFAVVGEAERKYRGMAVTYIQMKSSSLIVDRRQ
jgi:putative acetyltransferase